MTATECISYIDAIEPNAYTSAQKLGWLSECEGKVYTQLFLTQPYEFTPVTDGSRILAMPAPYDRIYPRYLQAMIHYANGEYDRYANSMAVFNEVWGELNRWFGGDFDVTDRLRNRRFEAAVNPEPGYQTLMEIPQGCALVAGRIIIRKPYVVDIPRYYAIEAIPAGSYSRDNGNETYGNWTLTEEIPAGGWMRYDVPHSRVYWRESLEDPLHTDVVLSTGASATGTVLDFTCYSQLWLDDKENKVGDKINMEERGTRPIPMLLGERGGSVLGITVGPGYWDPNSPTGEMSFTGHLLIPDEEWAYEDRYARRRDARWQS